LEQIRIYSFGSCKLLQSVRQLNFTAAARLCPLQYIKNSRPDNVPAQYRDIGRRSFRRRFLNQVQYAVYLAVNRMTINNAILAHIGSRNLLIAQYARLIKLEHIDQLLQTRLVAIHDVIAEQNSERFVADEALGAIDCVTKALRLLLPDVMNINH